MSVLLLILGLLLASARLAGSYLLVWILPESFIRFREVIFSFLLPRGSNYIYVCGLEKCLPLVVGCEGLAW